MAKLIETMGFSCLELLNVAKKDFVLKTGCDILDDILCGGFHTGITEISGESGSGKTSFALQLLFQCCLDKYDNGLNGTPLLISSIGGNCFKIRLQQLNKYYTSKYNNNSNKYDFMSKIQIYDSKTIEDIAQLLFTQLECLIKSLNGKLLIIDSIADFFRLESDYLPRAELFNKICQHLRYLSHEYNLIIIIINQVSDVINDNTNPLIALHSSGTLISNGRYVKPALGLAWTNNIDTRIMLTKHMNNENTLCLRRIHIIFSPYMGCCTIDFVINDNGIRCMTEQKAILLQQHKQKEKIETEEKSESEENEENIDILDVD